MEEEFHEKEASGFYGIENLYNIDYIITELKNFLLGYSTDIVRGKLVFKKVSEPLINTEGIHMILSVFYSFCNPLITGTGKVDTTTANALIENFADSLLRLLVANAKKWNIKKGYFLIIYNKLLNAYSLIVSRSERGIGLYLSHGIQPPQERKVSLFPFHSNKEVTEEYG